MHIRATPSGSKLTANGFVTVMLLIIIVLMGTFATRVMLSTVSEVQREREAELIFRGEAIANAIRSYKKEMGTYPLTLEDLLSVRPRIIRKLYKDPMTVTHHQYKGNWDLIFDKSTLAVGTLGSPLVGVRSFCKLDSKKVYRGKDLISDWCFIGEEIDD